MSLSLSSLVFNYFDYFPVICHRSVYVGRTVEVMVLYCSIAWSVKYRYWSFAWYLRM